MERGKDGGREGRREREREGWRERGKTGGREGRTGTLPAEDTRASFFF
jgi:hypothetical protein